MVHCSQRRLVVIVLDFLVTHYYHSGFSVACESTILIFDYWLGEEGELTENLQLTPERLSRYKHIYVFISHDHIDHMDPVVFTWKDIPGIQYIVSSDMPVGTRGRRMAPGDTIAFSEDVKVTAFRGYHDEFQGAKRGETLLFLIETEGLRVVHLGDLGDDLSEEAARGLAKPDILMIPVGGFFTIDAKKASRIAEKLEARIILPMHYKTEYNAEWPISGPEAFLSLYGSDEIGRGGEALRVTRGDLMCHPRVVLL